MPGSALVTDPPVHAVILAAGKGTRMRSARVKVLHRLWGLPLLEHVLRSVLRAGASTLSVVVGHQAEQVRQAFVGRGLTFVTQDPPLGTGHALQAVGGFSAATVLVVSGDVPLLRARTLARLLDAHHASGAAASVLTAVVPDAGAYGRVLRDADGALNAIVEARDATVAERAVREINAGIYAFAASALAEVLPLLEPKNAQGEYYLTDVISLLRARGLKVAAVVADDAAEVQGVNSLLELAQAAEVLRRRRIDELLASGVAIEDPASTQIGPDVQLEPDASVRPFCILEGTSRVGRGAVVGPYVHLVDVEVGEDAQILDHCLLRECVVEAHASVGPFAHIRPQSRIGPGAKVGNFVELKKTHLGAGAKAPHLAYLGDATIGARVNVGAGTITCNYDGQHKHPTQIEAGAFIGSNSTLVAPVTVGADAYVAAGSVITEDVPARALALGRARQVIKPGWRARRGKKPAGEHATPPADAPGRKGGR